MEQVEENDAFMVFKWSAEATQLLNAALGLRRMYACISYPCIFWARTGLGLHSFNTFLTINLLVKKNGQKNLHLILT